jgi:hypothetical protein
MLMCVSHCVPLTFVGAGEVELQAVGLQHLDDLVDTFWPEIATHITKM